MGPIQKRTEKDIMMTTSEHQQPVPQEGQGTNPALQHQKECTNSLQFPYYAAAAALPRVVHTAANPLIPIPAGRIVDDSSRGTLFWEIVEDPVEKTKTEEATEQDADEKVERDQEVGDGAKTASESIKCDASTSTNGDSDNSAKTDDKVDRGKTSSKEDTFEASFDNDSNWTIPFKVEWLSPPGKTVPFYKVRSIRNAYNKNRYLKIARDGTEVEPSVAKKLVDMFHEE